MARRGAAFDISGLTGKESAAMTSSLIGLGLAGTKQARPLIQQDWFMDKIMSEYFRSDTGRNVMGWNNDDRDRKNHIRQHFRTILKIERLPPGFGKKVDERAVFMTELRRKRDRQQRGWIKLSALRFETDSKSALRRYREGAHSRFEVMARVVGHQVGKCWKYPNEDVSHRAFNRDKCSGSTGKSSWDKSYSGCSVTVTKRWAKDVYNKGLSIIDGQFTFEATPDPIMPGRFVVRYLHARKTEKSKTKLSIRLAFVRQDPATRIATFEVAEGVTT